MNNRLILGTQKMTRYYIYHIIFKQNKSYCLETWFLNRNIITTTHLPLRLSLAYPSTHKIIPDIHPRFIVADSVSLAEAVNTCRAVRAVRTVRLYHRHRPNKHARLAAVIVIIAASVTSLTPLWPLLYINHVIDCYFQAHIII